MTDDRPTIVSILTVVRSAAACVAEIAKKDPLVYALWITSFALAGGMMLFILALAHAGRLA